MLCSFIQISEVSGAGSVIINTAFNNDYSHFICFSSFNNLCQFTEHWPFREVICAETEAAADDDWWQNCEQTFDDLNFESWCGCVVFFYNTVNYSFCTLTLLVVHQKVYLGYLGVLAHDSRLLNYYNFYTITSASPQSHWQQTSFAQNEIMKK